MGNLGVSFCVDDSQGDCYVLDTFGFRDRRLGYSWRHHSALESGIGAWVPGKDLMPENTIKTEPDVSTGLQGVRAQLKLLPSNCL